MGEYGIWKNKEGYSDPTAGAVLSKASREERLLYLRVGDLIHELKELIDEAGFELLARIELRDKKTGREFR